MVAGRVGSAISAELGSMVGDNRSTHAATAPAGAKTCNAEVIVALVIALPLLTIACDLFGLFGGGIIAQQIYGLDSHVYISSVRAGVDIEDLIGGIIKPLRSDLLSASSPATRGLIRPAAPSASPGHDKCGCFAGSTDRR